ncbi:uncharacterized protein [Misgurnus anguillicaudatus]|uniref:uncharacterized protein n=1 Tax=Misgurnus anguillicaudatus TaxID=75329 RepID=UPI003CCFBF24
MTTWSSGLELSYTTHLLLYVSGVWCVSFCWSKMAVVTEATLKNMLKQYKYRDLTVHEIMNVISRHKDLKPVMDTYLFTDGSTSDLVCLTGTIPVSYRGNVYNIPVCLWLLDTYPHNPPICFVKPTSTMMIKTGKQIDAHGKIFLSYMHEWKHPQSDLYGLIQVMIVVFGEEPPVFSRPTTQPPYQGLQAAGPPNREPAGDSSHSDLRIVLLGYKKAGKSSSGNIILNREEFDLKTSAQCVKRQREVADRHITVIEAPGWWTTPVDQSSELLKEEILLSVSLCPPGPHIVLLVIRVDRRFKEDERKVFQGYVDLLSERVWSHTIVLFTHGDFLGDTSIEQHIESEGEDLQWLVEKCGNRYHLLNNNNRSDETQIKDLLEKIEETVTENNGCHFEMDRKILQEMEERRRAEKERAEERMKRMKKQREMIRSQMMRGDKL